MIIVNLYAVREARTGPNAVYDEDWVGPMTPSAVAANRHFVGLLPLVPDGASGAAATAGDALDVGLSDVGRTAETRSSFRQCRASSSRTEAAIVEKASVGLGVP